MLVERAGSKEEKHQTQSSREHKHLMRPEEMRAGKVRGPQGGSGHRCHLLLRSQEDKPETVTVFAVWRSPSVTSVGASRVR